MTIFRWIIGILTVLLATGTALTFLIYVITGDNDWKKLCVKIRRWLYSALLLWFNIEIWVRVFQAFVE
jgi:hypothetical protein